MNKKVIYITPVLNGFTRLDKEILSEEFKVVCHEFGWLEPKKVMFSYLSQVLFLIRNMPGSAAIVISFAGYWSLLPTLFAKLAGKPSFIIMHGTESASLPDINHGLLRKPITRLICKWSFKWAKELLPVSESLIKTENSYNPEISFRNQGIKNFFPDLDISYEVIHNGVDGDFWQKQDGIQKEEHTFLSVMNSRGFRNKGLDLIVHSAKSFPNYRFYVAGMDQPNEIESVPNLIFTGLLTPEKLREYYSKSSFYLQLSRFESFGLSICEAMLCECIPIASSVNMLPDIVSSTGFILDKRDEKLLESLIEEAIDLSDSEMKVHSMAARKHILTQFPIEKRRKKLLTAISKYVS